MIMGKLYHYCANNQKTGDPEWELMPSALESMLAKIEHDQASEYTPNVQLQVSHSVENSATNK